MSLGSSTKLATCSLAIALLAVSLHSISFGENSNRKWLEGTYELPRMATYDDAAAGTMFALSLSPQLENAGESASDVIIFVDTSASQSGVFKKDSMATLKKFLSKLSADDRVKLVAVDLDPVVLTPNFVGPASAEIAVAIENLQNRVALGSTDMALMLDSVPGHFTENNNRNRNVIYIGDGISRAGFLTSTRFSKSLSGLVSAKVSLSSFAIGPERNIELLAALANNTGGNVFVDTDDESSMDNGATGLAQTVHGMVFWPSEVELPESINEVYPKTLPPMRSGRDSVVVGTITNRDEMEINVTGTLNGETRKMTWTLTPEPTHFDFAFLPKLVRMARRDGGQSLPTVGSEGLRHIASSIDADADLLTDLGQQAMATGNLERAKQLAEAALASNPNSPEAAVLAAKAGYAIQEDDPFDGGDAPMEDAPGNAPQEDDPFGNKKEETPPQQDPFEELKTEETAPKDPPVETIAPPEPEIVAAETTAQDGQEVVESTDDALRMIDPVELPQDELQQLLEQGRGEARDLVGRENDLIVVRTERLTRQIEFELSQAQKELGYAPGQAIERMKAMVDVLDQTVDVLPERRQDLRVRLESSLMSARREKLAFDNRVAMDQQRKAAGREHQQTIREFERREEEISRLINRFDSLMSEGKYDEGEIVTYEAFQVDDARPETILAYESSRMINSAMQQVELRRQREVNFVANLYQVESAATPFSGNPPLVFPDAQEWAEKVARRSKYKDVRLAGNDNDEKILRALERPATFDFDDTTFDEVMDKLRDDYQINVVLDQSARDDLLSEDEPITFRVNSIRLKNALRLMLKEKNATYIVRDEVLRIISLDVASDPENFVTNVFNVGDLVAPRRNFGGGIGQRGGGQGGFGGGNQGGAAQGRGGGLGAGGGGGGGVFCVKDTLSFGDQTSDDDVAQEKAAASRNPEFLKLAEGETWDSFFNIENNFASPADVRYTVRRLMKQKETKEVVELINGALKNGQSQVWMFEALVLAMQIDNRPKSEIERVLMSTVDISDNEQDALVAADFMVKSGMEKRAIRLLQDVSANNPNRPEPFVLGLKAAQRINDVDGIQWATTGILSQAWPSHREIVKQAVYASKALQSEFQKQGRLEELAEYGKAVEDALYRDCIVKVSWTGEADLDIFVQEPGGTICSRYNPRTTAGGVMMGDEYTQSNQQGETAEYYVLPKGFSGDYRLGVRKVWGKVAAGKITVQIYTNFRMPNQASEQRQIVLHDNGNAVNFKLAEGRLEKPLEEHAIQTIAEEQFITNRRVLAQQLADGYSAAAASEYYESRGGAPSQSDGGLAGLQQNNLLDPRAVGYRPEVTQLFEGTGMNVSHATTADRLHVLISASPNFTAITAVDTFNILGDADTAGGTGGTGGGGLGGGLF